MVYVLILNFLMFLFLGAIWNGKEWLNILLKMVFFIMAFVNAFVVCYMSHQLFHV